MNTPSNENPDNMQQPEQSALSASAIASAIEHFQAIIESSDDAIISKTLSGVVTSWNAGAESLFGYRAEEMIGRSMQSLFPQERMDEEYFIQEKILAGEKVNHFETIRIHKSGRRLNVSVTISPIRDVRGRIVGASKIARDISERIRLENSARHFESIVQSSDDAIIAKSLDGIITSWNAGAQAMFGFTDREMIGQSMYVLLPPERYDEENQILDTLRRGDKIQNFETVRIAKGGRRIDVSVTISPIRDRNNKIIGASKIARDITTQKQLQARLQLTASVFTNTHEGIIITDATGIIIEVNDAFSRLSGYARDEIVGQTPRIFQSSNQELDIANQIQASLMKTGYSQEEVKSRRKDGEAYAGLLTINVVKNGKGEIQNYVGLFSDITALHEKQKQLEHFAHFDSLTELPNRILLADRLRQAMATSQRHQQPLAVLYMDLDYFKDVNDQHGHDVGDKLLIAISQRMKKAMRDIDTLARIGGDEFVAILQDVGNQLECNHLAERILHACAEPIVVEDKILKVSVSIGMTLYPQDEVDATQLLRHADKAMYEAKQIGKNRIRLFDPGLKASTN